MKEHSDQILWQVITYMVQFHSAFHPRPDSIDRNDLVRLYFPTPKDRFDEHANRWGAVLFETIDSANMVFKPKKPYLYDFTYREEWKLFITLGDYLEYMKKKVEENE
jgi:hypothetical protein